MTATTHIESLNFLIDGRVVMVKGKRVALNEIFRYYKNIAEVVKLLAGEIWKEKGVEGGTILKFRIVKTKEGMLVPVVSGIMPKAMIELLAKHYKELPVKHASDFYDIREVHSFMIA